MKRRDFWCNVFVKVPRAAPISISVEHYERIAGNSHAVHEKKSVFSEKSKRAAETRGKSRKKSKKSKKAEKVEKWKSEKIVKISN